MTAQVAQPSAVPVTQDPAAAGSPPPSRPNIVWISNEDMSPHIGAYGDALARTPTGDAVKRGFPCGGDGTGMKNVNAQVAARVDSRQHKADFAGELVQCDAHAVGRSSLDRKAMLPPLLKGDGPIGGRRVAAAGALDMRRGDDFLEGAVDGAS
jgi:hypothetical protein